MSEEEHKPNAEESKAKAFVSQWKAEQERMQAEIEAKAEALKLREQKAEIKEAEIEAKAAELEAQERKDLMGKLGVSDEEEAKKYLEKPLEVLRELVEYKAKIKISGGGIPKDANQPVKEEIVRTSDGLQFKQKLRKADGTWVEV